MVQYPRKYEADRRERGPGNKFKNRSESCLRRHAHPQKGAYAFLHSEAYDRMRDRGTIRAKEEDSYKDKLV